MYGSDIGWVKRLEAERDRLRQQLDMYRTRPLATEVDRLRAALAALVTAVDRIEPDETWLRDAADHAREALEGPADA